MNCKEVEKEVYLYRELTDAEKAKVDEHTHHCKKCTALLETVVAYQSAIAQIADVRPQPENYARLTSNIMQAIDSPSTKKNWDFNSLFDNAIIKYAMTFLSIVLISWFCFEQQHGTYAPIVSHASITPSVKTVPLNTSSILKSVREKIGTKNTEPFSLYACAKSESCEIFKNFKKKKTS